MERLDVLSKKDLISLLELINACVEIENVVGLEIQLDRLKSLIQFDCTVCTYLDFKMLKQNSTNAIKSLSFDFPSDFLESYFNQQLWKIDIPVLTFLKTFNIQNVQECIDVHYGGKINSLDAHLKDYGLSDGWINGILHVQEKCLSIFSFMADRVENNDRSKIIIEVCTPYLTQVLRRMNGILPSPKAMLTPREAEMLNWLKEGKTSWEISKILSISERCVNFHIENAKRKLDAVNRVQAVAIAVSQGLIQI